MTDAHAAFIEKRIASGEYAGASDYVQDLVRQDMQRDEERQQLKAFLRRRMAQDIGEGDRLDDAAWESILTEARRRVRSESV